MRFMLRDVRLAFPSLWQPSAPRGQQGGEKAFNAAFLIPKNHPQIAEIKAAIAKTAQEKWLAKAPAILKALESADKTCLHNGDAKSDYEGFEGNYFISARSKVRPSVFDAQRQDLTEADGKPYTGCYVNASIELWAQENGFGRRVNAQLRGVQFLRDGDRFAGGASAADADEFDEIGVEGVEGGDEPSDDDLTS